MLNKPRPLWSPSPSCDYRFHPACGSSVMDIWWSGVFKMNGFCLFPWQGVKREWINETPCLFFDQRLPTWKALSPWVQHIAGCRLSSERVRGQVGTIKQKNWKISNQCSIKHNSLTKRVKNARTFITTCPRAKATNHKNHRLIFMSSNNTGGKKHKCPVFFILLLCSRFITQTKSFINASSWNLKGIITVMNCIPCGFNCADAAWSSDLVNSHCVDGKSYLEKQKKACKWQRWWQTQRIIIPQYCSLSNQSQPIFFYAICVCTHTHACTA